MRVRTFCPAKLNLFLSVGPKDARGWHPLRTIFQAIDLGDDLGISANDRDEFLCDVDWVPTDNSVIRALAALRRHLQVPPLRIELVKRIPAQAGLGGGSSDAAGMLRAVPELLGKRLPDEILHALALELGADVSFFLVGGRARGEGYGEKLTPLPDPPESFYLVVKPDIDCATAEMYQRLDAQERAWRDFPKDDLIFNDFEKVMPHACHRAIDLLSAYGADDAGLTGSGSAVFGTFPDHTASLTAASLMRAEGYRQLWAVRSLSREESLRVEGL